MSANKETVPCKWCGKPTLMTGTQMCDQHWELDRRISAEPEMAALMLGVLMGAGTSERAAELYALIWHERLKPVSTGEKNDAKA